MSIYYTNTNNREIFAHSITATVINGTTGVTGGLIPSPIGPTAPTGPLPVTPLLMSGSTGLTFTPISGYYGVTGITNCNYIQIGDIVNVSFFSQSLGWTGPTEVGGRLSLPIARIGNFTNASEGTGTCNTISDLITGSEVIAEPGTNTMNFSFLSTLGTTGGATGGFIYDVEGIFNYSVI